MSLLGPLWLWAFVDLPLAVLAAGLWWHVRHMPHPLPPVDFFERVPPVRRPITRDEIDQLTVPVYGITATSAYAGPFRVTPYGGRS